MTWQLEWDDKARRELRKLDASTQREILRYLRECVAKSENPSTLGKFLTGKLAGYWRYRVRDYRIICTHEKEQLVILVIRVAHRREVYNP